MGIGVFHRERGGPGHGGGGGEDEVLVEVGVSFPTTRATVPMITLGQFQGKRGCRRLNPGTLAH